MKKLGFILAAALMIAATGCGDSKSPVLTYVARANSDGVPHLFTLNEATGQSTAVAIAIPDSASFVSANSDATAVTYCRVSDTTDTYEIYVMGLDGVEKQLTTNGDACESVFSPDGKLIAFVSLQTGDFVVYTMNLDGSNQQPLYLADAGTMEQFFPEFSADGKSIAFESETLAAAANAQPHHKGVRASSWTDHKLQSRAKAHGSAAPALSTNGIYTMHLTDATPTLAYETTNWAGPAVFSGDGSKLLLTLWGDGDFMNISSVNLDGTALTPLTTNPDTDSFAPVPYKNLIIFNRANNDTSSWDIYAMDQSGGNQALVHSTADTDESLNDAFWD